MFLHVLKLVEVCELFPERTVYFARATEWIQEIGKYISTMRENNKEPISSVEGKCSLNRRHFPHE